MNLAKNRKELDELNNKLVVVNKSAAGYQKGDKIVVQVGTATLGYQYYDCPNNRRIRRTDFDVAPATLADFQKDLKKLTAEYNKQKQLIEDKIEYLTESKAGAYDELECKTYSILKRIESNPSLSISEKTALILPLMR